MGKVEREIMDENIKFIFGKLSFHSKITCFLPVLLT